MRRVRPDRPLGAGPRPRIMGSVPDARPGRPMPGPTAPEPADWTGDRDYLTVLARVTLPPWLRGRVDPSDVVQQALANAVVHRDQLRGEGTGPRRAWLRQILVNQVRDAVRRHRWPEGLERSVQLVLDESSRRLDALLAADQSGPGDRAGKLEDLRRLTHAVARLPAGHAVGGGLEHPPGGAGPPDRDPPGP